MKQINIHSSFQFIISQQQLLLWTNTCHAQHLLLAWACNWEYEAKASTRIKTAGKTAQWSYDQDSPRGYLCIIACCVAAKQHFTDLLCLAEKALFSQWATMPYFSCYAFLHALQKGNKKHINIQNANSEKGNGTSKKASEDAKSRTLIGIYAMQWVALIPFSFLFT